MDRTETKARSRNRTLGPVQDLERHLPTDWWRSLFNAVYLQTDGDVVEDDSATEREIDLLIDAVGLKPEHRILDLCCGQGRHLLALARRGFQHLTGIDRSRYLIRLARRRATKAGLDVKFHEGDARRFRLPQQPYDCVTVMGNSFGYFEQLKEDLAVLRRIRQALVPGGTVALDLADGQWLADHHEPRSWEWIDQDQLVCRERKLSDDRTRLVCREVVVHAERGVIADQFYAERLFTPQSIEEMLRDAGFRRIQLRDSLIGQSTRNQDLGMMARRMFLTATTPPEAASRMPALRNITVLMGDPSLPDAVKRGGKYNPEDFETIQKLKDALAELKEFDFHYLTEHSSLFGRLTEKRPEFVLNFCDEGYRNDAMKELHLPALLEMLDIPHSGAAPACLATCYDKATVRAVARDLDIPVPGQTIFELDDQAAHLPSTFPALLKPAQGDGSIGITAQSVVNSPDELLVSASRIRREWPGRAILVQDFLTGPEYSVGLIGNPGIGFHILPILEVDYSQLPSTLPPILGYESKWEPDSPYWSKLSYHKAELKEEVRRALVDYSLKLFERLACRDYARFDYRCSNDGIPRLLEVNPNPGWVWDGKLNMMAGMEDQTYPQLLRRILNAALDRIQS
ncbi:MAG: methyltransferase domain-containing protein [Planctomycetaceae bacterium]